jgi:hypothetical protein
MNSKLQALVGGEVGTPEYQALINELISLAQRTGHVKVTQTQSASFGPGTLVAVDSYDATLGCLKVVKADAASGIPAQFVMSETLLTGGVGIAYSGGVVGGMNTSAASAVGSKMYLGAAGGGVWAVDVVTGHVNQKVGVVTVKHASSGAVAFNLGGYTINGDVPLGTVIGDATITNLRGGKVTLNGVNPTRVLFGDPDAASILGTDDGATKNMGNGKTMTVNPDAAGDNTVTFAATAGTSTSAAAPSTDMSASPDTKFKIAYNGAAAVTVTCDWATGDGGGACDTGAKIAAEMQEKIRAALAGNPAVTVTYGATYVITSAQLGTGSAIVITAAADHNCTEELKIGVADGGAEAAGTGDFADAAAATAAEIAAAIHARATGWDAEAVGNKVRCFSKTSGKDSSLVVNAACTADSVIGVTGSAYGAQGLGYDTDMANDDYLVALSLTGVNAAGIAGDSVSTNTKTVAGFLIESETTAATHDVDVIVAGVPA